MAYQIPQQLVYKEKIMFGLNFKQLAYALVCGIPAITSFKIVQGDVGIVLAFLWVSLGICFMFLDLDRHIRDYWAYFKSRNIVLTKDSLYPFLGIKSIEDNVICMDQGRKAAILRINPINFSIKLPEEKDAIISSFQKFLNSLDFPTQILMNTESIQLHEYLNALELRMPQKGFASLFTAYKEYLQKVVSTNKIMNRVFYLIVPEYGDLEIQMNVCMERFAALNLKVERLKTKEIDALIRKFFPQKQHEKKEDEEDVHIQNHPSFLDVNKTCFRIISASGYPRTVEAGFLDKIVSLLGDFNLSMHIQPYPIERMLVDINKELQKQRADLYAMKTKHIINPFLEIQYKDTKRTLEALQKGKERLFHLSLYIVCKAGSAKELDLLTKKVEAELNSLMIMPRVASFRMLQGFRSILPLGKDDLKAQRNMTTGALSAFFPFTSQFLQADSTGVWLGLNKNNIPIIKDIFKLPNPNGVVLAQSGGGKSYFCKLLITRYLLNGTKVMIIDPQGEYKSLVKRFNGQIIDLSRASETLINPLDLMGHDYTEKRLSLMDLMPVMLGNLSEPQKSFLDKALTYAYQKKGITLQEETWSNVPPTLRDVLEGLNKLERKATQVEKATLRSVINRLEMYVTGVFGFLDRHTNISFDSGLVCFDLSNMPKQLKPVMMFLVLDYVYMKMKSDLSRKILLIDEAWSLLSRTEDAGYILEIVKTCRKFNLGLLLINQEVEELFNSQAGKSVLANSAYTLLMRQKPSVIHKICEAFHLSPSEKEHLLTASVGEGLLIMEDEHSKIRVLASPEEHAVITTNADELLQQASTGFLDRKKEGHNITVDLDKQFYRIKELKKEEAEYLKTQGYLPFKHISVVSNKNEKFLLKPRHNESLAHCFFVYDIKQFFEKRGIEPEIYTTKMPDIVFRLNGKRYALEIETGTVARYLKQLQEKIEILNKQADEWIFVVTNKKLVQKYRKHGKTIDPRYLRNQLLKIVKTHQK